MGGRFPKTVADGRSTVRVVGSPAVPCLHPSEGERVCAGFEDTLRPRVRRPGEACVRWSGRRGQAGEVPDDDRVAVRVAVSEGELRPLSGQFLAAAFAPGAGLVASGLVEVQRVAAGVDAEKGEAARILLHRAHFLL